MDGRFFYNWVSIEHIGLSLNGLYGDDAEIVIGPIFLEINNFFFKYKINIS